jgi:hypothetical protein
MTAEIVIMNTSGAALAADSALTYGKNRKIFRSATKIFPLSTKHQVGVMIFSTPSYMDVPFDVVLRLFQDQLGDRQLPHLSDYMTEFLAFLRSEPRLIPEERQSFFFSCMCHDLLSSKREEYLAALQAIPDIDEKGKKRLFAGILREARMKWAKAERAEGFDDVPRESLGDRHEEFDLVWGFFEDFPQGKRLKTDAYEACLDYYLKCSVIESGISGLGLVFVGFGTEDLFPSTDSIRIEGYAYGLLRAGKHEVDKIDYHNTSALNPFAQSETVESFITGINSELLDEIDAMWSGVGKVMDDELEIKCSGKRSLRDLRKEMGEVFTNASEAGKAAFKDHIREKHVEPWFHMVAGMPREEMASLAESLVNLTSMRLRFCGDEETVSGPTDVAIISKSEGFIWVKRKANRDGNGLDGRA